jgi:hypothetical protein
MYSKGNCRNKNTIIDFSYLCTYDLHSPVRNVFDACRSIKRASGRGLGPGNGEFLGPVKWPRADRRVHLVCRLNMGLQVGCIGDVSMRLY